MIRRSPEQWQSWLEEFSKGQEPEAWRGIMCFFRWIQIREENGHAVPGFLEALEGDIFHSHLLRRLLGKQEPLEYPPPESFGQPWYELVEKGVGVATVVTPWAWAPDSKISINQGIWSILDRISDSEYIVNYHPECEAYRLVRRSESQWELTRLDAATQPSFTTIASSTS
jgi:hypothetical protein